MFNKSLFYFKSKPDCMKHRSIINKISITLLITFTALSSFILIKDKKPTLYVIGDSTVKNGGGTGGGGLWGWGDFIAPYFDTSKISIENDARGGTSSRTFQTQGLWDKVLNKIQKGDYVIMQFGHNDGSPLDDTARARGTIKGIGDESKEIYNPITKKQEVVHTYGWYMRKFINDAKAKGATAIVCSPIPRNDWKDGKVSRSTTDGYAKWAQEIAKAEGLAFINLNDVIATNYEALGTDAVKAFFPGDHTHTNVEGAKLNASIVVDGIRQTKPAGLQNYLLKK
jgi:rhamnogalacturonan acetylesterase